MALDAGYTLPAAPTKPKAPATLSNIGSMIGKATSGFGSITGATPKTAYSGGYTGGLVDAFKGVGGASAGGAQAYVDALPPSPRPSPLPPQQSPGQPPTQGPATDPEVLIKQLLERLGIGQVDADLRSARERAIIGFGDPALASMAGFGIDPQAGVFAKQNYLSGNAELARIDKANERARKQIVDRLAARGLLRSGDLGYLEGEQAQAYGSAQYDARQKVLDYLTQAQQQAQERKNALRQSVIQSVMAAYQNYAQNPQQYMSLFGG